METLEKYNYLKKTISDYRKIAIAYSGGVDSSFLLKVCIDTLNADNVLAVIAFTTLMPQTKQDFAIETASKIGATLKIVSPEIANKPEFNQNSPERCYICKKYLYGAIKQAAAKDGFEILACGTNFDDLEDYRPGNKAGEELSIRSPLADAKLTKNEIRTLSKTLHLPTADMPSSPCMASRIPYFEKITDEKLNQIGQAESFLHQLGFKYCRVRHLTTTARIEVPVADFDGLLNSLTRRKIIDKFKELGFIYISMDIEGLRSGAMNECL